MLCSFYCFIHVYPRATWDVEGIKDRKDVLTTRAVAWTERTSISPTCAETATFKFCRLCSTNYRLRQPMNWAPFEDTPKTCAAFPPSKILDDSFTWHVTLKTEIWATPVSTSSSTSEAPIAQARDMPPFYWIPARLLTLWMSKKVTKILITIWMSTECKETGATTTDDSSLKIVPGMWTLGTIGSSSLLSCDTSALDRSRSGPPANQRAGSVVGEATGRRERPASNSVVPFCQ